MNQELVEKYITDVNGSLDAESVLRVIGFSTDKIQVAGDSIKAFCPIHKDLKFRSLIAEPKARTYKCTLKTCPGVTGGNLVDLYALSTEVEPLVAAANLAAQFDIEIPEEEKESLSAQMLVAAHAHMTAGKTDLAAERARSALLFRPDFIEARLLLAKALSDQGDSAGASEEYVQLVESYLAEKQFVEAESAIEQALKVYPDSEDVLFLSVRSAELQGQKDVQLSRMQNILRKREEQGRQLDNLGVLAEMVQLDPKNVEYHLSLAELHEQRRDLRKAAGALDAAAKILKEQGREEEATPILERLIELNPEAVRNRLTLVEQLVREGEFEKAGEQAFKAIEQQIDQQDYMSAIKTGERWMEVEPDSIEMREILARVYQDIGRPEEAGAQLRNAANIARRQKDLQRASDLFFRLKFITPEDLESRDSLVEVLLETGQNERVVFELIDLAEMKFTQGDDEGGNGLLDRAAGLPTDARVLVQVAQAMRMHNRGTEADDLLLSAGEKAVEAADSENAAAVFAELHAVHPEHPDYAFRYCELLYEVDINAAAEVAVEVADHLLSVHELDKLSRLFALAATKADSFSEANIRLLDMALAVDEIVSAGMLYSAVIQGLADHDARAALGAVRKLMEKDPDHPTALSDCAILLANNGYPEEAASAYAELALSSIGHGDADTALAQLEEAIQLDPERADLYILRADAVAVADGPEAAAPIYAEYLEYVREVADPVQHAMGLKAYTDRFTDNPQLVREAAEKLAQAERYEEAAQKYSVLAAQARRHGELQVASVLQQQAAELYPSDVQGLVLLAEDYQGLKDVRLAAETYLAAARISAANARDYTESIGFAARATALTPDDDDAWELLADLYEEAGEHDESRKTREELANVLRRIGRPAEAVLHLQKLCEKWPAELDYFRQLAAAHAENGDSDMAVNIYSKLGERYQQLGRYGEMVAVAEDASYLEAPDPRQLAQLYSVLQQMPEGTPKRLAELRYAMVLASAGKFAEAAEIAAQAGTSKEEQTQAASLWVSLGERHPVSDKAAECWLNAAKAARQAFGDSDLRVEEYVKHATRRRHDYAEAWSFWENLLEEQGDEDRMYQCRVHRLLAEAVSLPGPELDANLAAMVSQAGDSWQRHRYLGEQLLLAGMLEEGIAALETAVELCGDCLSDEYLEICNVDQHATRMSARLSVAKGNALAATGETGQANAWFAEAALDAQRAEDVSRAQQVAEAWLEVMPQSDTGRVILAWALVQQDENQNAATRLLEAAEIRQQGNDVMGARELIDEAMQLDPENLEIRRLSYALYKASGELDQAGSQGLELAETCEARGETDDAIAVLRDVSSFVLRPIPVLEKLATLLEKHKGWQEAEAVWTRLLEQKQKVHPDLATEEYAALLQEHSASTMVRRSFARFLEGRGKAEDAQQEWIRLAYSLAGALKIEQAIDRLNHALSMGDAPELAPHWVQLSDWQIAENDPVAAVANRRKAVDGFLELKDGVSAYPLAKELAAQQRTAWDLVSFARAAALKGENLVAEEVFAQAMEVVQEGPDTPERIEVYRVVLEFDPVNEVAAEGLIRAVVDGEVHDETVRIVDEMRNAGEMEMAGRILELALQRVPHDLYLRQEVLRNFRIQGNIESLKSGLIGLARAANEAGDKAVKLSALREIVDSSITAEQYSQAAELASELDASSLAADAHLSAARLLAGAGDTASGAELFTRAMELDSELANLELIVEIIALCGELVHDAALPLMKQALARGNHARARAISDAILSDSSIDAGLDILNELRKGGGEKVLVPSARKFNEALSSLSKVQETLQLAQWLVNHAPQSADAMALASAIYRESKNATLSANAAILAGSLYRESGLEADEERVLKTALELAPENISLLEKLVDLLSTERPAEAADYTRRLTQVAARINDRESQLHWMVMTVNLDPGDTQTRMQLAELYNHEGRYTDAMEQWQEAGTTAARSGDDELATQCFQRVLGIDPENEHGLQYMIDKAREAGSDSQVAQYTLKLVEVRSASGATSNAVQLLSELVKADPDNPKALKKLVTLSRVAHDNESYILGSLLLGEYLQRHNANAEAVSNFEAVLEARPRDLSIYQKLIDCHAVEGDVEKCRDLARRMLEVAQALGDHEQIRESALRVLDFDEQQASVRRALADSYLALNRIPEAAIEYQRAAEILEGDHAMAQALDCYHKVLRIQPGHGAALRKAADLSLAIGASDAAIDLYLQVLDRYLEDGEGAKADAIINRLVHIDPENMELHERALDVHRRLNRLEKAAAEIQWLIREHLEQGNTTEAERLVQEGLEIAPESLSLQRARLDIIRKMGRTEEFQTRLREMADEALKREDWESAASAYEQIRDAAPERLDVSLKLVELYFTMKRTGEAIEEAARSIRDLLQREQNEEAREHSLAVVSAFGSSLEMRARLAEVFSENGLPDVAARHYADCAEIARAGKDHLAEVEFLRRGVAARPRWVEGQKKLLAACKRAGDYADINAAYTNLGSLLIDIRNFEEAANVFRDWSKTDQENPAPLERLIELHRRIGDRDQQISTLEELAHCYLDQNRTEKAIACYKELADLQPDDPDAISRYLELFSELGNELEVVSKYQDLAEAYSARGKQDEAMKAFEQALAIDFNNTETREKFCSYLLNQGEKGRALVEMRRLAELYSQRGLFEEAIEVLSGALVIDPQSADLCLALAGAQESAGYHDEAVQTYARASSILSGTSTVKSINVYQRLLESDSNNAIVRRRLAEALLRADRRDEAAREAKVLAELHSSRDEMDEAESAMALMNEALPESIDDLRAAIMQDSYDPSLQYLHYVRLGDALFSTGEIDQALDAYRSARSIRDDRTGVIRKCIDSLALVAPEAEAISDYLVLSEKLMHKDPMEARKVYEHVLRLDPFNADAKRGLAAALDAEKDEAVGGRQNRDDQVLRSEPRERVRRIGLGDLLKACQDAASADENGEKEASA